MNLTIYIVKFLIHLITEFKTITKLLSSLISFFKLSLIETNIYISSFLFILNNKDKDLIVKSNKRTLLRTDLFIISCIVLTLLTISISKILI